MWLANFGRQRRENCNAIVSLVVLKIQTSFLIFRWILRNFTRTICVNSLWNVGSLSRVDLSVKFQRKDQSIEGFTSKCLFLLFWPISCVSLVFLIEIWSFCSNLLGNYPVHKINYPSLESSPCAGITQCWQGSIVCTYFFCFYSRPCSVWPEWCKDQCFSLYNGLLCLWL